MNIRINQQLKELLDWGCSLRPGVDVPWITGKALKMHEESAANVEDYEEFTGGTGISVTFPEIPEHISNIEFRAILAAYLKRHREKSTYLPPLELDSYLQERMKRYEGCTMEVKK